MVVLAWLVIAQIMMNQPFLFLVACYHALILFVNSHLELEIAYVKSLW